MRVVADTNVIVSAFLWGGVPRQLLDAAEDERIGLFASRALQWFEFIASRVNIGIWMFDAEFARYGLCSL